MRRNLRKLMVVWALAACTAHAADVEHGQPGSVGAAGRLYSAAALVPFATSSANFRPDAGAQELLAMAPSAVAIYVRGRTSTMKGSASDEKLAAMRALSARAYLVAHGVAPLKININFASASDYVVDNSTPEGKAKNQRVEIEMILIRSPDADEHQALNEYMQQRRP